MDSSIRGQSLMPLDSTSMLAIALSYGVFVDELSVSDAG